MKAAQFRETGFALRPARTFLVRAPLLIQQRSSILPATRSIGRWRLASSSGGPPKSSASPLSAGMGCPTSGKDAIYPYRRLHGSEIRLLKILPGSSDEPLACELEQVALSSRPIFHSLSYCWGEQGDHQTIHLNGRRFHVTKNLYDALRQFRALQDRDPVFRGALWIDAICIDQANLDERSAQVARMTQIYSSAIRTVVWLGAAGSDQENQHTGELFEKARALGDRARRETDASKANSQFARFPLGPHGSRMIMAFYALCKERPWFRRIWVVQEIVASSGDPVLYCGTHHARLSELVRLYGVLIRENTPLVTAIVGRSGSQLQRLGRIRNNFSRAKDKGKGRGGVLTLQRSHSSPASFFASLLIYFSGLKSTDPRDQIYGMLALGRAAGNLPSYLDADYRLDYQEIYHRYAKYLIQETEALELINCRRNQLSSRVPSWVPDFRHIWAPSLSITRDSRPPGTEHVSISEDGRVLEVQGFSLGRCVASVPPGPDDMPSDDDVPEALTNRLQLIRREIIEPVSRGKGVCDSVVQEQFMRSGRFNCQLWERMSHRKAHMRSSEEKTTLTAESLAEERRIAVYVRAAFAILGNGRILRCYRRDSVTLLPDDVVCMLVGARTPCILRPVDGMDGQFRYLGNCRILDGRSWKRKANIGPVTQKTTTKFWLV
ncbi:HET-domain-containing protein [Thozetella sp. PMI_491]|nr:HET-domain-containing protein [Thozetella sp. PMI_491]